MILLLGLLGPMAFIGNSTQAAAATNAPAPDAAQPIAPSTNAVVAKGKGVSVTRGQIDDEMIRIKSTMAAQGRSMPGESDVVERQVLDSLISRQLLLAKATAADKAKGKEQFDASLEKFKTNGHLTEEEFNERLNQQLKILGLTKEQWENQGIEQAALPIVLERELKVNVTQDQARKFYDDNPAQFEQPEMVRAAHILLMTRDPVTRKELTDDQKAAKKKQIEDILKRARAGEDFAKLAKEYSEDPGSKDKGGEYTFPRGQMMPEFEAAAFSLNTNQISDVVTTSWGYHIIKLYEKIPAKMTAFDKVAPDIHQYLAQREIQKEVPDYIQKLKKEADVKILDERLNAVEVPKAPVDAVPDAATDPAKK